MNFAAQFVTFPISYHIMEYLAELFNILSAYLYFIDTSIN